MLNTEVAFTGRLSAALFVFGQLAAIAPCKRFSVDTLKKVIHTASHDSLLTLPCHD